VNLDLDRRKFLKGGGGLALALPTLSLSAILAACGDSGSGGAASGTTNAATATTAAAKRTNVTLRFPFVQEMQPPDPDTYMGEGMQVVQSCYEGLLDYVPGTATFRGQLAEKWEVSSDLLTYTFHLKPGVKFHDGTPADAASWVKSFQRRLDRNQGPAYMIAFVESTSAPDPTTFIIKLKEPNNAYLHYLACPWRPFAVSPTAIAANSVNGDFGKAWLATHDAGTGPYMLTEVVPATRYSLEVFKDWWGPPPAVTHIDIEVIPDAATRRLKLESGDFDLVPKGFSYDDLLHFKSDSGYKTYINSAAGLIAVYFNLNSGVLADPELRAAVMQAIDRKAVLDGAYQGAITPSNSIFSEAVVPPGRFPFNTKYDPTVLTKLIKAKGAKSIDLAYGSSGGAASARMAELIQTQLSALGMKVTTRVMSAAQTYALGTGPANQRPDMLLASNWSSGDALHLDTGLRIQVRTGATLLNYFAYSDAKVDAEMDAALREPTDDLANKHYQTISDILHAQNYVLPLGRDIAGLVTDKGVDDVVLNSYLRYIFAPASLTFEK